MSLIAWYPLNGDTLDCSGNNDIDIVGTVANIVQSNEGKIGKCYETKSVASGGYMRSTDSVDLGQKQSIFAWVNIVALSTSSALNGLIDQHRTNASTAASPSSGMGITAK